MDTYRLTADQPESVVFQLSPTQTVSRHLAGTQGHPWMCVRSAVPQIFSLRLQPTELQESTPFAGSPSPVRFTKPSQHSLIPREWHLESVQKMQTSNRKRSAYHPRGCAFSNVDDLADSVSQLPRRRRVVYLEERGRKSCVKELPDRGAVPGRDHDPDLGYAYLDNDRPGGVLEQDFLPWPQVGQSPLVPLHL